MMVNRRLERLCCFYNLLYSLPHVLDGSGDDVAPLPSIKKMKNEKQQQKYKKVYL
jgi:hypothetical protein